MAARRKLSASEKKTNVQNGLTPGGAIPLKGRPDRDIKSIHQVPVGRPAPHGGRGSYPPGDYRCTGKQFTTARKNHYCRVVRESGEEALARAEVGISYNMVQQHKVKDLAFRDAIDEAFRQHASLYAKEMKRRGLDGYAEPVFGSQGPGQGSGVVGFIQRYSDRLLIKQAERFNKEYTPAQKIEQTTTHKSSPALRLDQLSAESRADLRRILEREAIDEPVDEPQPPESPQEG